MNILNSIDGFLDMIFGVVEPYVTILFMILVKFMLICLIGLCILLIGLFIYYCIMACITKIQIVNNKAKDDYKIDVKEWEGGK